MEILNKNEQLSRNPDALRQAIQDVKANNAHIHPPQIALQLGVPEACLVACEIEQDEGAQTVYRLRNDVVNLLSPITQWGRLLIVFSNASGVFMPLKTVEKCEVADSRLCFHSEDFSAFIDYSVITDGYFVCLDDGVHGETRSLQFFDRFGAPVVKFYLFNQEKLSDAKRHFLTFKNVNQWRTAEFISDGSAEHNLGLNHALSHSHNEATSSIPPETHDDLSTLIEAGSLGQFEFFTSHAFSKWSGKMNKVSYDNGRLHIHSSSLRAHLRLSVIDTLEQGEGDTITAYSKQRKLLTFNQTEFCK